MFGWLFGKKEIKGKWRMESEYTGNDHLYREVVVYINNTYEKYSEKYMFQVLTYLRYLMLEKDEEVNFTLDFKNNVTAHVVCTEVYETHNIRVRCPIRVKGTSFGTIYLKTPVDFPEKYKNIEANALGWILNWEDIKLEKYSDDQELKEDTQSDAIMDTMVVTFPGYGIREKERKFACKYYMDWDDFELGG